MSALPDKPIKLMERSMHRQTISRETPSMAQMTKEH